MYVYVYVYATLNGDSAWVLGAPLLWCGLVGSGKIRGRRLLLGWQRSLDALAAVQEALQDTTGVLAAASTTDPMR